MLQGVTLAGRLDEIWREQEGRLGDTERRPHIGTDKYLRIQVRYCLYLTRNRMLVILVMLIAMLVLRIQVQYLP